MEDRHGASGWVFDIEERLAGLSKKGDDLERLAAVIDFELFRLIRKKSADLEAQRPDFLLQPWAF